MPVDGDRDRAPGPAPGDDEPRGVTDGEPGADRGDELRGVVDDEPGADQAEQQELADATRSAGQPAGGGHVSAEVDWVPSDEDDPDSGSGRTGADDGGYLPGEATGRPQRG
jgi:hypothetical protein